MATETQGLQFVARNIATKAELGELAKVGSTLGYRVIIDRDPEINDRAQVTMVRAESVFGQSEITAMVMIEAMAWNRTLDQVLESVRAEAKRIGFPTDKKYADTRGAGEGSDS